jgi:hypothetical protein
MKALVCLAVGAVLMPAPALGQNKEVAYLQERTSASIVTNSCRTDSPERIGLRMAVEVGRSGVRPYDAKHARASGESGRRLTPTV